MAALSTGEGPEPLPQTERFELSNGLLVHLVSSPSAALTTATVAFSGSDAFEACHDPAAAVSAMALESALNQRGPSMALWHVEFADSSFLVSLELLSSDPNVLSDLLARGLMVRPDAEQVAKARQRVLESMAIRDLGGPALAVAALEEWRLGVPRAERGVIASVDVAQVSHCLRPQEPAQVRVVVASGSDPAEIRSALEHGFSSWRTGAVVSSEDRAPTVPATQTRLRVVHRDVGSVSFAGAIVGPAYSEPDHPAFSLLAYLFGGGSHSKLQQALRDRLGLTYWTGADVRYFRDRSVLVVTTSVDRERLNKALRALDDEIDGLEAMSELEFEAARNSLREQIKATLERPATSTRLLAGWARRADSPSAFMQNWIRALDGLTADEVRRVALKYFRAASTPLIVVGDRAVVASQLQWTSRKFEIVDIYHRQLLPD